MPQTYRTKDGVDRTLPGIGRTVNGQITTDAKIENRMFELVTDKAEPAPAPAPAASPAPTTPAANAQPADKGATA